MQKVPKLKMFHLFLTEMIFPFNDKFDGFFKKTYKLNLTSVEASGSTMVWNRTKQKDILTKPEFAVDPEADDYEWCSDINKTLFDHPWILFNFKKRKFQMSGYSLKQACCDAVGCCCIIYSWSMQGSNDNKTWTTIDKQEKQRDFNDCDTKSWEVSSQQRYSYIRLIQDEPFPKCWYCIGLSKIEIYGTLSGAEMDNFDSNQDADDEVSIIGKVYNNDK